MKKALLFVILLLMAKSSLAAEKTSYGVSMIGDSCGNRASDSCERTIAAGGAKISTDNLTRTEAVQKTTTTITGGESDIISGGHDGKAVSGTVMRWTVTITNSGSIATTKMNSANVIPWLTPISIVANSFDIDANGDGTFETTGVGNGYDSGGIAITVNHGTPIAYVTISSI